MSDRVDLQQEVAITLPRGAWQAVVQLVARGPWLEVDPLIQVMRHQLATAGQGAPQQGVGVPGANGSAGVGDARTGA